MGGGGGLEKSIYRGRLPKGVGLGQFAGLRVGGLARQREWCF